MVCVLCDHATASTKASVLSGSSVRPVVHNGTERGCVLVLRSVGGMVLSLREMEQGQVWWSV